MRALNIGVAAHLTAASPGGPRFDATLSFDERTAIGNAIWLCQNCAALIDRDTDRFTVPGLLEWRHRAERAAACDLGAGTEFRPLTAGEVRQEMTLGEILAIKALAEEFGCHLETNVGIPLAKGSWLNLHGAVARGEELIAVEIREFDGRGLPYFQIEHLAGLLKNETPERFSGFVLYIAVVSSAPVALDDEVGTKLKAIASCAGIETHVRLYRLNELRARYGI
jgi:hypothetical protein